ncbi:HAD hydrolase-like protein [Protaetiibacter larvae]|uniref:HAD hydrolase-like protein n=1 Tax=Protaetiibacter larvae TaxID=2592654 RepID=A0A5C1Y5U1_9MICO|nr:HAD hydrolase-like protein [Protaetiibacter larvae]QEO09080.1 HAD hydrolase-like protein [Protaetiibacter larvae]
MLPRPTAVLFDLDGTIVDSAPGIVSSLAHTLEQLGLPVPTPAELLAWVGPPILDSFRDRAGLDHEESLRALAVYRTHYRAVGILDAAPYPGVVDAIRAIHAAGIALSLATSKPESSATVILEGIGVIDAFDELTGATEDETRSAKADVVAEALRRLTADGFDVSGAVMVGDRILDIEGARANGLPTIFASWGYGAPAEAAGAIAVVADAGELRRALGIA